MTVMSPMFGGGTARATLWDAISRAGLAANCRVCLDAGDALSYSGTGQIWTDRSGNQNFFLGASATPSTDDPTFNGTAGGLSSNEYFVYDGNDFFRPEGGAPAWSQTLHKAGALFTILAIIQKESGQNARVCGSGLGSANNVGFVFDTTSTNDDHIVFGITNGGATSFIKLADDPIKLRCPTTIAVSLSEASGTADSFFWENGTYKKVSGDIFFDGAYSLSTPSSGNASGIVELGSRGSGQFAAPNGVGIHGLAIWTGQKLSKNELNDIYLQMRDRWVTV